jgi:formylglycine-generating enzyme required for sulfatase activity
LRTIRDLQGDTAGFVSESDIARKAGLPLKNVRYCLVVLHENGFISLVMRTDGCVASIEAKGRLALTYPSNVPLVRFGTCNVVPKGLRSFSENDSGFFLELLPGARDDRGLPEGISYWKDRIEAPDSEGSFRLGILYGPSGCGKTSLIRAGLVPNLVDDIHVVYVEASSDQTERLLLAAIKRNCRDLADVDGLASALSALANGRGIPEGKRKFLLVVDQFEQWLVVNRSGETGELITALQNCNGERLQAIVLVRVDFWMAVTRFMAEVGVEIGQSSNCKDIDLFGKRHALKVLKLFGQAFGALPADAGDLKAEQAKFLEEAITELAREEKDEGIAPVRLSLFAQMLSEKEWSSATLKRAGGSHGLGVDFLEATFDTDRGRRRFQLTRRDVQACQSILKALLPEGGAEIKRGMRSEHDLRSASGFGDDRREFLRLIRILDSEIRLITPTEPDSTGEEGQPQVAGSATYYRLTHDYLVRSLTDWLTSKQKGTRRGRAEILLAERSAAWNVRRVNGNLPSLREWVQVRALTKKRTWTDPEREMMSKAADFHGTRVGVGLLLIMVGTMVALDVRQRFDEVRKATYATGLVRRLLDAETDEVPGMLGEIKSYRAWVEPLLRQAYAQPDDDPTVRTDLSFLQKFTREAIESASQFADPARARIQAETKRMREDRRRLHSSLALLQFDQSQVECLYGRLLDAQPQEIAVITEALGKTGHGAELTGRLWDVVERPRRGHENQRLRAACALATYDKESKRWDADGPAVVEQFVSVSPLHPALLDALRPVKDKLLGPLTTIFRDESPDRTDERHTAASILADYCATNSEMLARLLMDSDDKQFSVLFPLIAGQDHVFSLLGSQGAAVGSLEWATIGEVTIKGIPLAPIRDVTDPTKEAKAKREARAAVALLRLGRSQTAWKFLPHSPDPRVKSYIVNWLKPLGADPNVLMTRLNSLPNDPIPSREDQKSRMESILFHPQTSERRSLILALGTYDADRFSAADSQPLVARLLETYRNHPDAGVHGAAEWTLRRWNQAESLKTVDIDLQSLKNRGDRRWYVNREGQTMAVIEGPVEFTMGSPIAEPNRLDSEAKHHETIKQRFALSAKELTVAEYEKFLGQNLKIAKFAINEYSSPGTCPMNGLNWYEAAAYCNWLSAQDGLDKSQWCYEPNSAGEYGAGMRVVDHLLDRSGYRLPTEAEWEFACRAGATTSRYYGQTAELMAKYAWCLQGSDYRPGPCGQLLPNDLGLFDMLGNMREWCQDVYRADPDEGKGPRSEDLNPSSVDEKSMRVIKGGGFRDPPVLIRSAVRYNIKPSERSAALGFRAARTMPRSPFLEFRGNRTGSKRTDPSRSTGPRS